MEAFSAKDGYRQPATIGFLSAPVAFDCPKYVSGFPLFATPLPYHAKLLNLLGDPMKLTSSKPFYRRPGHDLTEIAGHHRLAVVLLLFSVSFSRRGRYAVRFNLRLTPCYSVRPRRGKQPVALGTGSSVLPGIGIACFSVSASPVETDLGAQETQVRRHRSSPYLHAKFFRHLPGRLFIGVEFDL